MNSAPQHRPLASFDGTELGLRQWIVDDARGTVVVVHGFGEHSGRYHHVQQFLAENGYSSFAVDYRGWGTAAGRRGFVQRYEHYLGDIQAAIAAAKSTTPSAPCFLLGHSQGGLVAALTALDADALAGVILVSPAFRFAVEIPWWKRSIGHVASMLWPTLALPSGIQRSRLTHDQATLDALEEDPLVYRRATARWFTESLAAQRRALERAARFPHPLLLLIAGADEIVDVAAAETFFESCGHTDKQCERYADWYHEILNEVDRHQPLTRICGWLSERL